MYRFQGRAPSKPSFLFIIKMKLVPFILTKKKVNTFHVTSCNIFLSHAGKSVWKINEPETVSLQTILQEYCEPNGLYVQKTFLDKLSQIIYLQIDTTKTNLSEFYSWEEALAHPNKPECWRKFYFIQDKEGADWWSPQGLIEGEIQDLGNIANCYERIQTYFKDT